MNTLDIVLLVTLSVGGIYGYTKGLISQLTFGVGLAIGLLQAIIYYPIVGERLLLHIEISPFICNIFSFIGIVAVSVLLFKVLGTVSTAILKALHLNIINKLAGAILSAFFAALLFIGIVKGVNTLFPEIPETSQTSQNSSLLYKHVCGGTTMIIEEVKKEIDEKTKQQHIP